jgi:hypothetical protein
VTNPERRAIALAVIGATAAIAVGIAVGQKIWRGNQTEKSTRQAEIAKWISENKEGGVLVPPASDRQFWEALPKPPELVPPTKDEQSTVDIAAEQLAHYNRKAWLLPLAREMQYLLLEPSWSQPPGRVYLRSTHVAASLAHALALAEDRLPPELVERTKREIRQRVIDPLMDDNEAYQTRLLSWQIDKAPWLEKPNNWKAVCWANAVYAALVIEEPKRAAEVVAAAEEDMERYLKTFEEDGYLSAGIRYWTYGISHYVVLAESLLNATGGKINLYTNPKLANIAPFPVRWRLPKQASPEDEAASYPLFADNNNSPKVPKNTISALANRFEWPEEPPQKEDLPGDWQSPVIKAATISARNRPWTGSEKIPIPKWEQGQDFSTTMIRSGGSPLKTAIAVKAGHNGEEHNHNDVGSYTVFQEDKASTDGTWLYVTGDFGGAAYDEETQGKEAAAHPSKSSWGHPVPAINGQLQGEGPEFAGKIMERSKEGPTEKLVVDLTGAYGISGLEELKRTITFNTETGVTEVVDSFKARRALKMETAVITKKRRAVKENQTITIKEPEGRDYQIRPKAPQGADPQLNKSRSPDFDRWSWAASPNPTLRGTISYEIVPLEQGEKQLTEPSEGEKP